MFSNVGKSSVPVDEETIYIELKRLPSFAELNKKVKRVIEESSWFERFGIDWLHVLGAVVAYIVGHLWLGTNSLVNQLAGDSPCACCRFVGALGISSKNECSVVRHKGKGTKTGKGTFVPEIHPDVCKISLSLTTQGCQRCE